MSDNWSKAKFLLRANVFRCSPNIGHPAWARCRLRWDGSILVERHADVLFSAPDDVARDAHAVCLKYQREILGDVDGADHVEGRPRDGHIANYAVDDVATERNRSGHQHRLAGVCAPFHETFLLRKAVAGFRKSATASYSMGMVRNPRIQDHNALKGCRSAASPRPREARPCGGAMTEDLLPRMPNAAHRRHYRSGRADTSAPSAQPPHAAPAIFPRCWGRFVWAAWMRNAAQAEYDRPAALV